MIVSLYELFQDEIAEIFDAEKRFSEALPEIAQGFENGKLTKELMSRHQQSGQRIGRIEAIRAASASGRAAGASETMKALIDEARQMMEDIEDGRILDAALVLAVQKMEQYMMTTYCSLFALGECVGMEQAVLDLLDAGLQEERERSERLSRLAELEGVNERALQSVA